MPSRLDDHLADDLALLEQTQTLARLFQGEHAVDDGAELSIADHLEEHLEVGARPAVGSEDLELVRPDVAAVGPGIEPRGGAAGEHATTAAKALHGGHPGVPAGVVDDHVHAARGGATGRLAEEPVNLGHHVVGGVVDDDGGHGNLDARHAPRREHVVIVQRRRPHPYHRTGHEGRPSASAAACATRAARWIFSVPARGSSVTSSTSRGRW
jgi:hypothetical protein